MNEKEIKLAIEFLHMASDEFGNHGCNDVEEKLWDGWTKEERQKFVKEFHENNGDPEEYTPDFLHIPDFAIMDFLAYQLKSISQKELLLAYTKWLSTQTFDTFSSSMVDCFLNNL